MLEANLKINTAENDNSANPSPRTTIFDYSQVGDTPPFLDPSKRCDIDKYMSLFHRCVKEQEREKKEKGKNAPFWRDMALTKDGKPKGPKATDRNISAFCKRFGVVTRLDTFSGQYTLEGVPQHTSLNDHAVDDIMTAIRKMDCAVGVADVRRVLETEGRERRHAPLREYIMGLAWDGTPRVETVLIRHFGVEDTSLNRAMTKAWFVGAIRRLRHPGCQHDYVLVLIGREGLRKSRFFMIMGYTRFYTGSLPVGADDKTVIETCGGKWIVELNELSGINKSEDTDILTFITRPEDHGTLKWDKYASGVPRPFIMGGSTNDPAPLRGVDGNRRWWLLPCNNQLDEQLLLAERAQLWAEAVHLEGEGALNYLTPELEVQAKEVQRDAVRKTPIFLRLEELLEGQQGVLFTADLYDALGVMEPLKLKNVEQAQIDTAMRALGWIKGKPRITGNPGAGDQTLQRHGFTKDTDEVPVGAPSILMFDGVGFEAEHEADYIQADDLRKADRRRRKQG